MTTAPDNHVTLRPVQPKDEAFLLSIYASTRAEELALVPWNDEQREQFLRMQFAAQQQHYQTHYPDATHDLILLDERPIGRLYVDRGDAAEIRVLDLTLLPEARGRGVGTPLLRQLQAEAAATQRRLSIYLELNNRARSLFERLGFAQIEEKGFHLLYEWRVNLDGMQNDH